MGWVRSVLPANDKGWDVVWEAAADPLDRTI